MQTIRVLRLPELRVAVSGPIRTREAFTAFNQWFSAYHAALDGELCPRDFMCFNERLQATEWMYALPREEDGSHCAGFEITRFPGGLYAVAPCLDADLDKAADWMRTRQEIRQWVEAAPRFRLHVNGTDPGERWDLFQIVSPPALIPKGYSVEDLYVPIWEV